MPMIHDTVFIEDELHEEVDGSALPEPLKKAIKATPIAEKIVEIGNTHNLLIGEINSLYDLVKDMLLGQKSTKGFPGQLRESLDTDKHEFIPDIVERVNKDIFLAIREKMQGGGMPARPTPPEEKRKTPYGSMGTLPPQELRRPVSSRPAISSIPTAPKAPVAQPQRTVAAPILPKAPEPARPTIPQTVLPKAPVMQSEPQIAPSIQTDLPQRQEILREIENPTPTLKQPAPKPTIPQDLPTDNNVPTFVPREEVSMPKGEQSGEPLPPPPPKPKTAWKIQPKNAPLRSPIAENPSSLSTPIKPVTPSPGAPKDYGSGDPYREPLS